MRGISTPSRCRLRDEPCSAISAGRQRLKPHLLAIFGARLKACPFKADAESVFKEREDEASQLNRLGETGQAPSLLMILGEFSSAHSRQNFVVSPVQFLTWTEDAIELPNSFELKADS